MLGTMYGYYMITTPEDAWQIDSIVDCMSDHLAKYSAFVSQEDHKTQLALKAQYLMKDLPQWL